MTVQTTGWKLSRSPQRRATTVIMGVKGLTMAVDDKWRVIDFELANAESVSVDTSEYGMFVTLNLSRDVLNDLARYDGADCELRVQMVATVTRRFIWLKHVSAETVVSVIPRGRLTVTPAFSRCSVTARRTTTDIRGKPLPYGPKGGIIYYIDALRGPWLPRVLQVVNMRLPLWRLSWKKY